VGRVGFVDDAGGHCAPAPAGVEVVAVDDEDGEPCQDSDEAGGDGQTADFFEPVVEQRDGHGDEDGADDGAQPGDVLEGAGEGGADVAREPGH